MGKKKQSTELRTSPLPIQVSKQKDLKQMASQHWGVDHIQPYFPPLELMFKVEHLENIRDHGLKLDNPIQNILSSKKITTQNGDTKSIHIKQTMLVASHRWMRGDYGTTIGLPITAQDTKVLYDKLQLPHNAAYVGSLISGVLSQTKCIHFPEVFGIYTGIAKKHTIDISDDYAEYAEKSWFSQNVGKFFELKMADNIQDSLFQHTRTAKLEVRMDEDTTLGDVADMQGISLETEPVIADMKSMFEDDDIKEDTASVVSSVSTSYVFDIESCKCSEVSEDLDESEEDDEFAWATFSNVPVQLTVMEQCEGTLYQLMCLDTDTSKHMAWLTQVLFALAYAQRTIGLTHNDLHSNNIMYVKTEKEYLHYKMDGNTFKVPTFGYLIKIIDFERSIASIRVCGMRQPKQFVSDHFSPNEEAGGQYNIEPFHVQKIETIRPNPSFDLVRLATSMFWDLFPEGPEHDEYKANPIFTTLIRWMTLEDGTSVFFGKSAPSHERYHGFDLYKAITRYCKDTAIPRKEIQKLVGLYGVNVPPTTVIDLVLV
jgi:hypothetical protein